MQVSVMMMYVRDVALLKPPVDDLLGLMVTVRDGKTPAVRWRGDGGAEQHELERARAR